MAGLLLRMANSLVSKLLRTKSFGFVRVDGCAFGLKCKGTVVKKPWIIATTQLFGRKRS